MRAVSPLGRLSFWKDKIIDRFFALKRSRLEDGGFAPRLWKLNACEKISFGDTVLFDTARHDLKPQAGPALDAVAKVLLASSSIIVRVEGHTDSRGRAQYNQALSEHRANAVYDAFLRREVPARQMKVVGYGLTQPVDDNITDIGRAKNRRVDLVPHNC